MPKVNTMKRTANLLKISLLLSLLPASSSAALIFTIDTFTTDQLTISIPAGSTTLDATGTPPPDSGACSFFIIDPNGVNENWILGDTIGSGSGKINGIGFSRYGSIDSSLVDPFSSGDTVGFFSSDNISVGDTVTHPISITWPGSNVFDPSAVSSLTLEWGGDDQPPLRIKSEQLNFLSTSGALLSIEFTMVDAGYKTDEGHKFCRPREHERVFTLRGYYGWGKGLSKINPNRHKKYGTKTADAYVDELKNKLYAALVVDQPGPAYCHFPRKPEYDEAHFKGLTCENKDTKIGSGKQVLYWNNPSDARNEPIDCRNYAQEAFLSYPVNLEHRANKGLHGLFTAEPAPKPQRKKRKRGSIGIS